MLSQSLLWRKKHGVDKILSEYQVSTSYCFRDFDLLRLLGANTLVLKNLKISKSRWPEMFPFPEKLSRHHHRILRNADWMNQFSIIFPQLKNFSIFRGENTLEVLS